MTEPTQPPPSVPSTPAEKAMKQFAKTAAESGDPRQREAPAAPEGKRAVRPADAGVGESDHDGSSPYGDRSRPDAPPRQP